jgi:hypothetical protein
MKYWFEFFPQALDPMWLKVLIITLIAFFSFGFLANIIKSKQKAFFYKFWRSLSTWAFSIMAIGVFLTFFAYEEIPVLSMRFLFALWLIGAFIWLIFILKRLTTIGKIRKEKQEQAEYKKYIP